MSIFPIIYGCINAAHLGQSQGVPVVRTPLNAPFGTTDYAEIPVLYARDYAEQILRLCDEHEQKAKA